MGHPLFRMFANSNKFQFPLGVRDSGWLCQLYLFPFSDKVPRNEDETEKICKEFFSEVELLSLRADKLNEYQAEQRVKLFTMKKRYPHKREAVKIDRIEVGSPESSYVDAPTPSSNAPSSRKGIVITSYNNYGSSALDDNEWKHAWLLPFYVRLVLIAVSLVDIFASCEVVMMVLQH